MDEYFVDDFDGDEIGGYKISVMDDWEMHSSDVTKTVAFIDYDVTIKFEGTKEVSYEQWVDTNWGSWEYY